MLGGAGVAAGLLPGAWSPVYAAQVPQQMKIRPIRRAKVALIFPHRPSGQPTWPTKDYDYDARRTELSARLRKECPGTDFTADIVAHASSDVEKILAETKDVDAYLVYIIGIWTGVANQIMRSGKPTLIVDDLYAGSGEVLGPVPESRKNKWQAALICSSDFGDVVRGVRWLETLSAMKGARIVNVRDRDITEQTKLLQGIFGTSMVQMTSAELNERYTAADDKLARQWADWWKRGAENIVEVQDEDILKAGKIHVAFVKAMEDLQADALTMDCLGLYYSNKSRAYPCLSFFEMLNQGLTGICEADVDSTVTALLMRYLCNRPGFVSDPVVDTATNEVIYAHCVMSNRVYGPAGKTNKYVLRTHAEDRLGVSVQSLMPLNAPVTTARVALADRHMMLHSGTTTRNIDEFEKACRTKLAVKTNAQALLNNWTRGWHRVTVFGDYRRDLANIGQLAGLTVLEEDKEWMS